MSLGQKLIQSCRVLGSRGFRAVSGRMELRMSVMFV